MRPTEGTIAALESPDARSRSPPPATPTSPVMESIARRRFMRHAPGGTTTASSAARAWSGFCACAISGEADDAPRRPSGGSPVSGSTTVTARCGSRHLDEVGAHSGAVHVGRPSESATRTPRRSSKNATATPRAKSSSRSPSTAATRGRTPRACASLLRERSRGARLGAPSGGPRRPRAPSVERPQWNAVSASAW